MNAIPDSYIQTAAVVVVVAMTIIMERLQGQTRNLLVSILFLNKELIGNFTGHIKKHHLLKARVLQRLLTPVISV
jgi:hypothetical protein